MIDILDELYTALAAPLKEANEAGELPDINWENEGFTVVVEGSPYLEVMNYVDISPNELGNDSPSEISGFLQINVKTPSGIGTKMATGYIMKLLSFYKKGVFGFTSSGIQIQIRKAVPAGALEDKDWYIVPVTVYYTSFAQVGL